MAKTKAKAKVKTVVKNKAKATTSKIAAKKAAPAKKSPAKKTTIPAKSIKKAAPTKNAAATKKAIPSKAKKQVPAKKSAQAAKSVVKPVAKKKEVLTKTSKQKAEPVKKVVASASKPKDKPVKKETVADKLQAKKAVKQEKGEEVKKAKFDFPKKRAGRKPKNKNGDDDDGFELLEVPKLDPIAKKAPKKKFIIPVNPTVYVNPLAKQVATPKNMGTYRKFEIEFPIHASPYIIYSFISTPAGLSEWFAENVNVRNDEYTFLWDGSQQTATLLSKKENTFIKFRWNDEPDFTFFEFRIVVDEITQDVAFWVTDFAEDEKSKEASEMLWHSQIEALIHAMGA